MLLFLKISKAWFPQKCVKEKDSLASDSLKNFFQERYREAARDEVKQCGS